MNNNQDLLDLCRLNLMEENIKDNDAVDKEVTMQAINYKKKQLATRIINSTPKVTKKVMERHRITNTINGSYPWMTTNSK